MLCPFGWGSPVFGRSHAHQRQRIWRRSGGVEGESETPGSHKGVKLRSQEGCPSRGMRAFMVFQLELVSLLDTHTSVTEGRSSQPPKSYSRSHLHPYRFIMSSPTLTSTTCQSQSPTVDYHLNFKSAYTLWHLERNNSAKLLMELTELHVKDATELRRQSEQGRMIARSLAKAVADRLNDVLALNPYDETDRSMLIKLCDSDDEPWGDLQSESWDPMASIVRTEVDRLRALSHRTGLLAQV